MVKISSPKFPNLLAPRAASLLKALRLQTGNSIFKRPGQALIAALLVAFVLLLDAMVASPGLHELLHPDADQAGHECAVTMFIHGHVDASVVQVAVILPATPVEFSPLITASRFHTRTDQLPPGRGPPAGFLLA